jgi:metal-responsive CopG/Arc/MetJ family transcriptional regulator
MISSNRMGRKKLNRVRINVTLPEGMPEAASDAAAARGYDRSRLIEELLSDFLARQQEPPAKKKPARKPRTEDRS